MSDSATPRAVLIAGMHRSGTSATAGALRLLGVSLGRDLLAPGADNPKGYFENREAVAIHDRLLAGLDRAWDDVRALPVGWSESVAAQEAREAVARLVSVEFSGRRLWGVKDPRICRFLPLWRSVLEQSGAARPVVILVVRHPLEVAASIERRNGWPRDLAILLWLRYMLEAEVGSRGLPRAVITYERILADPVHALLVALEGVGVRVEAPAAEAVRSFVDASDRHHVYRLGDDWARSRFECIAREAYTAFLELAVPGAGPGALDSLAKDFDREWEVSARAIEALATALGAARASAQAFDNEAHQLRSELDAQLRWADEAVRKHEQLIAERDSVLSQLRAQIAWSEDAVRRHEATQAERDQLRSELTAQIRWAEEAVAVHRAVALERDQLRDQVHRLAVELDEIKGQAQQLADRLGLIERSRSWRLTAPLRHLAAHLRQWAG